jgi:hypothetical protein
MIPTDSADFLRGGHLSRNPPLEFTTGEVSAYYASRVPALRQLNREWRGLCPAHHGKGDKFSMEPETGRCYCHSQCGRGWDIIGPKMALAWRGDALRELSSGGM